MNHADAIKTLTEYFEDEGWCQRTSEAVAELQQSHSDEAYKALLMRLESSEAHNAELQRQLTESEQRNKEIFNEMREAHILAGMLNQRNSKTKHKLQIAENALKYQEDQRRKDWIRGTASSLMAANMGSHELDWGGAWQTAEYGWKCKPEDC